MAKNLILSLLFVGLLIPLQSNVTHAKDVTVTKAVTMVPSSFADIAEDLIPAVVNISSTQKTIIPQDFPEMPNFPEGSPFEDFFDEFMDRRGGRTPIRPRSSLGSGFIIDAKNGYIITNNHVVKNAENINITLANDVTIEAHLIGSDEKIDIAVLKIDTTALDLKDVQFGNSDNLRVGDWILAIGNPFGLGGSVTSGILSARARDIHSGPYDDYLQTDASINRGNSGGPLFDMNGKIIGINTAIFSPTGGSVGIGFAIPSNLAQPVIAQIIKYGAARRGWLGVHIQQVTEEIAESLSLDKPRGALIASVSKKGPAEKSGLQAGDIIISFNGQAIKTMKSLPRIVAENEIGVSVKIKYWRNSKMQETNVTIGELEKAEENGLLTSSIKTTSNGVDLEIVGLTLKEISNDLRNEFNIDKNTSGVFISNVKKLSEGFKKGLSDGNIIVEINQQSISTPQQIIDIVEKAQKNNRKSILLLINDNSSMRFVALKLKEH